MPVKKRKLLEKLIIAKDSIRDKNGNTVVGSIMLLEIIGNKSKVLLRGVTNYETHNSNNIDDNCIDVYTHSGKEPDVYLKHFSVWSRLKIWFKKHIMYPTNYDIIERSVLMDDKFLSDNALTIFILLAEIGVINIEEFIIRHNELDAYNLHGDFTFKKLYFLKWFNNTVHSS